MTDRNASASAFGWDFQINAAIILMLENIREAKSVRVEGKTEDVEITLSNRKKIYAQAKALVRPDDVSNTRKKLIDALETLNDAAAVGDGSLFSYLTNAANPFNDRESLSYFTGMTHLYFHELPDSVKTKVQEILKGRGYTNIDPEKMDVRVIPFYGEDTKNRYKEIISYVNDFLEGLDAANLGIKQDILSIWRDDFFQNATMPDTDITISKKKMIWPLIVLVTERKSASEYTKDFDDDEIDEIERKFKEIINQDSLRYDIISRVLTDYHNSEESNRKNFVEEHWTEYQDLLDDVILDGDEKKSLLQIILYRIISRRKIIQSIKEEVNLEIS